MTLNEPYQYFKVTPVFDVFCVICRKLSFEYLYSILGLVTGLKIFDYVIGGYP